MIGIMRTAVEGLFIGKGFIDQNPPLFYPFFYTRDQGTMEIPENQDGPVVILFKGVLAGFQIDLLKR